MKEEEILWCFMFLLFDSSKLPENISTRHPKTKKTATGDDQEEGEEGETKDR